ncbi:MAG TPA: hypothetical protein VFC36_03410 [Paludibacter sp.]|nr:hypothetical protein [Paludibacter sp.]
MSFCRQAAVEECAFRYKVIALAKTMTPSAVARTAGIGRFIP